MEGDATKFNYIAQNGTQLNPYGLFIYGIFHLTFSDLS